MRTTAFSEASISGGRRRARSFRAALLLLLLATPPAALAGQGSANEDRVAFERAMAHLKARNRTGAASEARKARGHDTEWGRKADLMLRLLDTLKLYDDSVTQIRGALRAKNQNQACELLSKIEADIAGWPQASERELRLDYHTDLPGLKRSVGECRPDLTTLSPDQQKQLDEAKSLAGRDKYDEAIAKLRDLRRLKSENAEVSDLLDQVVRRKNRQDQQGTLERCNALCDGAEADAAKGEFSQAIMVLQEARRLQACNRRVDELQNRLETARAEESKALGDAIDLYYKGQYAKSQTMLRAFQQGKHSSGRLELARFFLAASLGTEYYLEREAAAEAKKSEALALLATLKDPAAYMKVVSPRIRRLWEESRNQSKK